MLHDHDESEAQGSAAHENESAVAQSAAPADGPSEILIETAVASLEQTMDMIAPPAYVREDVKRLVDSLRRWQREGNPSEQAPAPIEAPTNS